MRLDRDLDFVIQDTKIFMAPDAPDAYTLFALEPGNVLKYNIN